MSVFRSWRHHGNLKNTGNTHKFSVKYKTHFRWLLGSGVDIIGSPLNLGLIMQLVMVC